MEQHLYCTQRILNTLSTRYGTRYIRKIDAHGLIFALSQKHENFIMLMYMYTPCSYIAGASGITIIDIKMLNIKLFLQNVHSTQRARPHTADKVINYLKHLCLYTAYTSFELKV
uniref:Uncharacterized protein n=1 Tax=Glossina austeni TaxID=7395 RepID=A0A1A9UWK1_GLOAU